MRGEVCVERDVRGCGAVHNYVHSEGVSTAWAGHAAERTRNMLRMSVTLEVSTVSEWLNARAFCRAERRGHSDATRGAWSGRPEGGAYVHCRGVSISVRRARGGDHVEHVAHACDLGRVEAQRLVEGRRALPSIGRGAERCGARCVWVGRREVMLCICALHTGVSSVHRSRGGAHAEHVAHVCDV